MIRTSLINGVINLDSDFSKYIESLSNPGVIEGFNVQDGVVKPGKARVKAERTNGETIYCYVENTEDVSLSGNDGKVYIVIDQEDIDSGLVSEDGSNIARIEEGDVRPVKNFLKIWSKTGAIIKDEREMVKTIESVQEDIESISEDVEVIDGKIEQIETQGVPTSALTETGVVGELYTLDDELYLQDVSEDLDLTEGVTVINVGYDKEETHIQRIANGISGNTVSLYIAKVGSPVTNFNVEIRKGIYAEAGGRAYWTGDSTQILASKSISYSSFTTDFQKITITFDDDIELQRGDLIDIVCYQSGVGDEKIKSTTNYYNILALDYQRGEGNSINYVDNGTITTSYIIAYCVGVFFCDKIFSKVKNTNIEAPLYQKYPGGTLGSNTGGYVQFPNISVTNKTSNQIACKINTDVTFRYSGSNLTFTFYYSFDNGTNRTSFDSHQGGDPYTINKTINIPTGSTMVLGERISGGSGTFETYYGDVKIEAVNAIGKDYDIIGKPTSILPVSSEMSVVTEGIVNGEWTSQSGGDLLKPFQNQDFKLNKDAIMVCHFSYQIAGGGTVTYKVKQDGTDYRIRKWGAGSSGNYCNGLILEQDIEWRLRGGHTYQIDFNPSSIREFYLA